MGGVEPRIHVSFSDGLSMGAYIYVRDFVLVVVSGSDLHSLLFHLSGIQVVVKFFAV